LLGGLLSAGHVFAAEVIQSFDSNVSVAKDGELTVIEALRVRAEGSAMRHGIYRDFPLTFRDAGGTLREVTFSLLGVTRDGQTEPYHTERTHGFIRIYAGDKDVLIRPGEHTYVFRYRTGRQVRWFDGKPELNWNVTGNFWRFAILQARYRLQLEGNARVVRWTAFNGRLGARGIDWQGALANDGALTVAATRTLAPGEGLTVVAELPAGAVEPPSLSTLLWYQLFDNRQWIFGGIGFLVVLIYYFAAWEVVGRDPRRGTIIPLFHPQGISPALANYIHNWGLGREKWRAFTAAALSLAVRGLIHFDQTGKALTLRKTGKQPEGGFASLSAGEGAIYSWVNIGGSASIDKAHGEAVAKVGTAFTTSIEAENRNRFFRRNLGYAIAGRGHDRGRHFRCGPVRRTTGPGYFDHGRLGLWRVPGGHVPGAGAARFVQRRQFHRAVSRRYVAGRAGHIFHHRHQFRARKFPERFRQRVATGLGVRFRLSVFLRADGRLRRAQWAVRLLDAGADRARPSDHGPAFRLPALSRNRRSRSPQHAGARDHRRALRGALALRGRPRRRKAVGAGLRGGAAPCASRRGRSDVALPAGLEQRRRLVGRQFRQRGRRQRRQRLERSGERDAGLVRLVRFQRRRRRLGRRWRRWGRLVGIGGTGDIHEPPC
jgi:hypothetical protein